MKRYFSILLLLLWSGLLQAESPAGIYVHATPLSFDDAYRKVYDALEAERFYVVFEPDMGKRMARFADKWGEDYNRNQLENVRGMVFCNIWQTNQVANADPHLLALCPLHLTVIHKQGVSTILFPRVARLAEGSPGHETALKLEQEIIGIIEKALSEQTE